MNHVDFCYWLQGYIDRGGLNPAPDQWTMIKKKLDEVFKTFTPQPWTDGMEVQKAPEKVEPTPATLDPDKIKKILEDLPKLTPNPPAIFPGILPAPSYLPPPRVPQYQPGEIWLNNAPRLG